jgi:hypothetical protein
VQTTSAKTIFGPTRNKNIKKIIDKKIELQKQCFFFILLYYNTPSWNSKKCRINIVADPIYSNPAHQQECLDWSVKQGFTNQEDALMMSGREREIAPEKRGLLGLPAEVRPAIEACVKGKLGSSRYNQIVSGQINPTPADDTAMNGCLESILR